MNGQSPSEHTEACASAPSCMEVVDMFALCVASSSPDEREMMMTYLRSKVCLLCGAPDPDCECYLMAEAIPS